MFYWKSDNMCALPDRAFPFLPINARASKPRAQGVTEIRGPYYTPMGTRYLEDILETMGEYVDALKFAGGSFALMPRPALTAVIDLCHRHDVLVSTGGFIEYVLGHGSDAVESYLVEARNVGFDIVELSSGFITLPADDWLRLADRVQKLGLRSKPELGIRFGAGGATPVAPSANEDVRDPALLVQLARRFLDAGAYMIMIESEGITENIDSWRTDTVAAIVGELGLGRIMFEAAEPAVFTWYVKHYGPDVNLFVDHSQIVQLECLRSGIWGTNELWGRVRTYRPSDTPDA